MRRLAPWLVSILGFIAGLAVVRMALQPSSPLSAVYSLKVELKSNGAPHISFSNERIQRFTAAGEIKDPLERDAAIYEALQELDAGDLAALAADLPNLANRFQALAEESSDNPFSTNPADLLAGAALDRWFSLDPKAPQNWFALMRHTISPEQLKKFGVDNSTISVAAKAFAKHSPEWTFQQILDSHDYKDLWDPLPALFEQVTHDNPKRGKEFLDRINAQGLNNEAIKGWAKGLADSDPMAVADYARDPNWPGPRDELLNLACAGAARRGPGSAALFLDRLSPMERRTRVWTAAITLDQESITDPLAFISSQAAIDPEILATQGHALFLGSLLTPNKPEAIDWVLNLPETVRDTYLDRLFSNCSVRDAQALLGRTAKQEEAGTTSPLGTALAARAGVLAAVDLVQQGNIEGAFQAFNPDAAARLDSALATNFAQSLWAEDPAAAQEWLQSVPPGAARDRLFQRFARLQSPEQATSYINGIIDPALRQQAVESAFGSLGFNDPVRSRAWISSLNGVDENWRSRMLRLLQ